MLDSNRFVVSNLDYKAVQQASFDIFCANATALIYYTCVARLKVQAHNYTVNFSTKDQKTISACLLAKYLCHATSIFCFLAYGDTYTIPLRGSSWFSKVCMVIVCPIQAYPVNLIELSRPDPMLNVVSVLDPKSSTHDIKYSLRSAMTGVVALL